MSKTYLASALHTTTPVDVVESIGGWVCGRYPLLAVFGSSIYVCGVRQPTLVSHLLEMELEQEQFFPANACV